MRSFSKAALATSFCLFFLTGFSFFLGAQTPATSKPEKTVEEAYLQDSLENMIIEEQSKSPTKDMKLLALKYARQAIDGGRKNPSIQKSLEYLALESSSMVIRVGGYGKATNDYPDVRREACLYLGEFPSVEAKDALLKVTLTDQEPMVLAAAISSLGKIGINDNDEVVTTISYIVRRFDILMPDNSLAFEALVAYERIAAKNNGIKDKATLNTIILIAGGNYIAPVKTKAADLLSQLRKYSASGSSSTQAQGAAAASTASGPNK